MVWLGGFGGEDVFDCVVFRQWFHQQETETWNQKSTFSHMMMRNRKASENEVLESFLCLSGDVCETWREAKGKEGFEGYEIEK